MKKTKEKNKGITLIALSVTIVVLLILLAISIGVLTGDNGIIEQAQTSKDKTEISEEREVVDISLAQAIENDKFGHIKKDILQEKLDNNAGKGTTETIDSGDYIIIRFVEKDRYYEINKEGEIDGPKELFEDEYAGDISKGGKQDGSETKPYQISCIEDLVVFSIMVNGGNSELGISNNPFSEKYIELTRTLDFNSIFSYDDYTTQKYGDLNKNGISEDIKTELTKKDENCVGFTSIGESAYTKSFKGKFNGNHNTIRNIYQNQEKNAGLFGGANNAIIQNLTVTGNINSINYTIGAICAEAINVQIINCHNKANVTEKGKINGNNPKIGGLIGNGNNCELINCSNMGNINGDAATGGVAGNLNGNIVNCYNLGNITGGLGGNYGAVGGILGVSSAEEENYSLLIVNCFNIGEITSNNTGNNIYASAGGILGSSGQFATNVKIINSYNIGKVNYSKQGYGGIVGGYWYNKDNMATLINTYYLEDDNLMGYGNRDNNLTEVKGIKKQTREYMYSNQLVTDLNNYIKNNIDGIDTNTWKTWKLGEENYPIFNE